MNEETTSPIDYSQIACFFRILIGGGGGGEFLSYLYISTTEPYINLIKIQTISVIKSGSYFGHGYNIRFCKKPCFSSTPKSVFIEIIGRQLCGPARWQSYHAMLHFRNPCHNVFQEKLHLHYVTALCFLLYIIIQHNKVSETQDFGPLLCQLWAPSEQINEFSNTCTSRIFADSVGREYMNCIMLKQQIKPVLPLYEPILDNML